MTRFARAKGSKSSNEKVPSEATPWSELKKGMVMKNEKLDEQTKKCVSLLKTKKEADKLPEWVCLDDDYTDSLSILRKHLQSKRKKDISIEGDIDASHTKGNEKKSKQKNSGYIKDICSTEKVKMNNNEKQVDSPIGTSNNMKKKRKKKGSLSEVEDDTKVEPAVKKKKKKFTNDGTSASENNETKPKKRKLQFNAEIVASNENVRDSVKEKKKKNKLVNESNGEEDGENEKKVQESDKKVKKKKIKNFTGGKINKKNSVFSKKSQGSKGGKKFKKRNDGGDHFKNNNFTTKINVGGESVSLIKFQGFYVTKDDAKRLKELKRKMVEEGIPLSQIESAIKLERRRCEKSLARMKKNVCFQCRKPGHILSQCPEIQNNVETGTGVCYKCGSTEHKAFTCKVTQGKNFPFAECFICKEKGHIARECPDNPRGLYPKGGCCKLCGDVTHLKKDCPKRLSEQEEKTIKLGLRDDRNLEGLEDGDVRGVGGVDGGQQEKKRKPVRF